jgi:hypothetical protein
VTLLARLSRHPFVRFALVGGAGYLVNAAMLALGSHWLHLPVEAALAFAIFIAMCFTWAGNRYRHLPTAAPMACAAWRRNGCASWAPIFWAPS